MLLQVLRIHNGCFVHILYASNHEMFSNLVHVPQGKKRFSRLRKGSESGKKPVVQQAVCLLQGKWLRALQNFEELS